MRVLFWGTPLFSIPSLDGLHGSTEHELISVVTQPDKPRGRGMRTSPSPVKERAIEISVGVLQPASTKDEDFIARVKSLEPDISVVVAYGKILHREILDVPHHGSVCIHPSFLPKYRGAAPIQRAIMDGAKTTGVTLFQMDEGMDTGPIILRKSVSISDDDTLDSLSEKLSLESRDLLLEGLSLISKGEAKAVPQEEEASVAPRISKEEALIDWGSEAQMIERRIRAFNSKPGAYTIIGGKTLKIYRAGLAPEEHDAEPGTVVRVLDDRVVVATGSGWLALFELQLEGKKRMDVASYLRGRKIEVGTKLG